MNVWKQLDALVAKNKEQGLELVELAKEGGVFRKPRFRPPCVWVLIFGAKSPLRGQRLVHTTYEAAKAELEPHVDAARRRKIEKLEAKKAEAAKKKGGRSR